MSQRARKGDYGEFSRAMAIHNAIVRVASLPYSLHRVVGLSGMVTTAGDE